VLTPSVLSTPRLRFLTASPFPKFFKKQVVGLSLYMLKETLDGDLSEGKELIANNVHR
jgi:hypothetical protein